MGAKHIIAVLTHGWILVGKMDSFSEELGLKLSYGAVIRDGKVTRGIGELVHGPNPQSLIDPIPGFMRIPRDAIVFTIDVDGWEVIDKMYKEDLAKR